MKQNTDPFKRLERNGPVEGPHVLLLSGVHGDEYEPMVACKKSFRKLKGKLLKGKVTFVPIVNPTAYQNGSRYGDDGLDLARICPGKKEGTSSERAAYAVSELINAADYLVDMHTGGVMYDIFPLAGYMLHADSQILNKQRQMACAWRLPLVWGTDPDPDGRTLSVARDAGIPAIYLEYGGGTGFRKKVVETYVAGFFNFLKSLGMIPGEPEFLAETEYYHVEDARQDSGYLQGKMPSPAEGIFLPKAKVGQQIKKGDQWGKITDPVTGQSSILFADTDGLVFLKRNLIKVKQGDALGGILPVIRPGRTFIDAQGKKTDATSQLRNDDSPAPRSSDSPEKTNTST